MSSPQRPSKKAVGDAIRELRNERGLTIEGLAYDADLSPTHVSGIERGRNNPSLGALCKLAGVLEVPLSEIVLRAEALTGATDPQL